MSVSVVGLRMSEVWGPMDLKCMKKSRKVLVFHSILRVLCAKFELTIHDLSRSNPPKKIKTQNFKGFPSSMVENLGRLIFTVTASHMTCQRCRERGTVQAINIHSPVTTTSHYQCCCFTRIWGWNPNSDTETLVIFWTRLPQTPLCKIVHSKKMTKNTLVQSHTISKIYVTTLIFKRFFLQT